MSWDQHAVWGPDSSRQRPRPLVFVKVAGLDEVKGHLIQRNKVRQ